MTRIGIDLTMIKARNYKAIEKGMVEIVNVLDVHIDKFNLLMVRLALENAMFRQFGDGQYINSPETAYWTVGAYLVVSNW